MQARALWAVALCGVCLTSRSDQIVGAEQAVLMRALQVQPSTPPDPSQGVVYICPMDPDVRSYKGGACRRCGTFPKSGMFRVLSDYYPVGATPQLTTETVFVPGEPPAAARLGRDYAPKAGTNMHVSLVTIPEQPTTGNRTQMRFTLDEDGGLEKYLGAWGHMLAASEDLIDMMHEHPFRADGGPQIEFEVVFPRAHTYRVWVQFQRDGVVNTVHFDVPVRTLE